MAKGKVISEFRVKHTYVHDDPVEREKAFIEIAKKTAIMLEIKHRNKEKKDNT